MIESETSREPSEGHEPAGAERAPGPKARVRTCVGCSEPENVADAGDVLVRLVLGPEGLIAVDAGNGGFGRGAHVHPRPDCLAGAAARGLPRAAKAKVFLDADPPEPLRAENLGQAIAAAMDRRIGGLLASAVRSRSVAFGSDAVVGACHRGEAFLVVVACDASAAAEIGEVRRAIAEGRAVAWGTKATLSEAVSTMTRSQGLGVIAVTRDKIAAELKRAVHVRDACASAKGVDRGGRRASVPAEQRENISPAGSASQGSLGGSQAERGA